MKRLGLLICLVSMYTNLFAQPCTYRDSFKPTLTNSCSTYTIGPYVGWAQFCSSAGYTGSGRYTLVKVCTDSLPSCINLTLSPGTYTGNMEITLFTNCWTNSPSGYINNSNKCINGSSGIYSTEGLALSANTCYVAAIWTKDTGTFQMCRQLSSKPTDDTCSGATTVPYIAASYNTSCYSHDPAKEPNNTCIAGVLKKSRWFKHVLTCDTFARFYFGNMNCTGGTSTSGYHISYFTGNCSSLTYLSCASGTSGTYNTTLNGLSTGQTIYILVNGNYGSNCGFTLRTDTPFIAKNVTQNIALCNGKNILVGGVPRTTAGTYKDTIWKACGSVTLIDSIRTINLTIKPISTMTVDTSICSGQSIFFKGQNRTTAGTYLDTFIKANGCDSILILNLGIKTNSIRIIDSQICQGSSVFFNGMTRTITGTFLDTLIRANGCDSFITLNLTVNPTASTNIFDTLCQGGSRFFNGISRTTSGIYRDTLVTSKNCDSFVILHLHVKPTSIKTIDSTICLGKSVFFKGLNRTTAGTYRDTLVNSKGCDSIVVLNLTIKNTSSTVLNSAICQGSFVFFKGQNRTTTGVYKDTFINSIGCDSFVVLNLTVKPHSFTTINTQICAGQSILFNSIWRTATGIYRDTLISANGCDSFITLNLIVNPTATTNIFDTLCQGGSRFFNGISRTTTGIYRDTFLTSKNCDSFIVLNLHVKNTSTQSLFDTVCQGQSIVFKGIARTTTGIYRDTLVNSVGCDSIILFNLLVKAIPTINAGSDTSRVLCATDSVRVGSAAIAGHSYLWSPSAGLASNTIAQPWAKPSSTTSYILEVTLTSTGCKRRDTIVVTVLPSTVNASVRKYLRTCKGATGQNLGGAPTASGGIGSYSYLWTPNLFLNNNTIANPGLINTQHGTFTYIIQVTDSKGCIARDTATVIIDSLPINAAGRDTNICRSFPLNLGKIPQNKINYTWSPAINLSSSNNSNPSFNSSSIGSFQYILSVSDSSNTCTLLDTITIQVNPQKYDTLRPNICAGQNYFFNGAPRSVSGTYFQTATTARGCDSFVVLYLTVNNTSTKTIDSQICQGSAVFFKGQNRTITGTYRDTFINSKNCDSLIILNLTVNPTPTTNLNVNICQGQSYSFKGIPRTTSGVYRDTLKTSKNCDSFIILTLNVSSKSFKTIDTAICQGRTYFFKGQARSTQQTVIDTLINTAGCDSLVTLNLSIKDTSTNILRDTICKNKLRFFNGNFLNITGSYKDTLVNAKGCDSFLYLHLVVKDTSSRQLFDTICSNQFINFNGINRTTSGVYCDTLTNARGCDSFLYLNLFVKSTSSSSRSITICANQSYFFKGQFRTASGIYRDTITNSRGCDSFVTLNLTVNSLSSKTIDTIICKDQTYFFKGQQRSTAGIYKDTLLNSKGCDSFATLNLAFKDTSRYVYADTICKNQPIFFNGQWRDVTGIYCDTSVNAAGCDSFVYLNLLVYNNSTQILRDTICSNQLYFFNNQNLNITGTYRDTFSNNLGCDSFVILYLVVHPTTSSARTIHICQGQSYFFKGKNETTSGIYYDTLINKKGCDSFTLLTLIVNPLPIANAGADQTRVNCDGDSVRLGSPPNPLYSYLWIPYLGIESATISNPYSKVNTQTIYELLVTNISTGCQARDTVVVNTLQSQLSGNAISKNLRCYHDFSGQLTIQAANGYEPYSYKVSGMGNYSSSNIISNLSATPSSTYTIKDHKGCLFSGSFVITQPDSIRIITTIKEDLKCFDDRKGKIAVKIRGGVPPYQYTWTRSPSIDSIADSLSAGEHIVSISDDSVCSKSHPETLNEPARIQLLNTIKTLNPCFGDSLGKIKAIAVGGTEPYHFRWSHGETSPLIDKLREGIYKLTIEDKNLCSDSFQVRLDDPRKLKIDSIYKNDLNCNDNGEIRITASGGTPPYLYSISDSATYKKDSLFRIYKAGQFQIAVLDRSLCLVKDSILIGFQNLLKIRLEPQEKIIRLGEQIQLGFRVLEGDSSLIQRLHWSPSIGLNCSDCAAPVASPFSTESYTLNIEYAGECETTDRLKINVVSNDELYIPSAFYPLSDKLENRTFKIYSNNILRAILAIYNRWGEKVYESVDPQRIGWNGEYKGEMMNTGIYYYHLDITYLDGRKLIRKGAIHLMR